MADDEIHVEPGQRLLCPARGHGEHGRCNRYFWTVPTGFVVHARALALNDGSSAGRHEFDEPCRRCKTRIRIRIVLDQRDQPATRSA